MQGKKRDEAQMMAANLMGGTYRMILLSQCEGMREWKESKLFVSTVAEGGVGGGFALAEAEGCFFSDFKFLRLKAGAFVGAIAERAVA